MNTYVLMHISIQEGKHKEYKNKNWRKKASSYIFDQHCIYSKVQKSLPYTLVNFLRAYLLKFSKSFSRTFWYIRTGICMYKETCQKHFFPFEKNIATTKIEFNENKAFSYFTLWNNGQRSHLTKTPLRTVIMKIKQRGTIEDRVCKDRPRKITVSNSMALA